MFEQLVLTRVRELIPSGVPVLCALSGGADSVALTLALCALREKAEIGGVICAHFNHGLRGRDSDADQEFCARLCDKLGVPLYTGRAGNISGGEADYRRLRYDFLIKTALEQDTSYIATAHTADDNAETLLLNLTRGTGLDGLSGIPAIRRTRLGVHIVRPMLDVSRSGVLEYLKKAGRDFRDDKSNHTGAYRRNRIRHNVIPELKKENPNLIEAMSRAAGLIKHDREYLEEQAALAHEEITVSAGTISVKGLLSLHPSLSGRVIRQICESAIGGPLELSARHIGAVMALCASGPSAVANLPRGLTARRIYDCLRIENTSENSTFAPVEIGFGQTVSLDGTGLWASWTKNPKKVNNLVYSFSLSSDTIDCGLIIRPRISGDSIRIAGRGHTKTLRRMFIDGKIPKHERPRVPVLADGGGAVAAGGFGVAERCSPKAGDPGTTLQIYREDGT